MESCTKQSHDPIHIPQSNTINPQTHHHNSQTQTHIKFIALLLSSFLLSYLILQNSNSITHILPLLILLVLLLNHLARKPQVYLVDFSCYKPPSECRVPFTTFVEHASLFGSFSKESVEFMTKVLENSGQGQETYLPPALHCLPPRPYHKESIDEVHMVLFPVMEDLLRKTRLSSRDIDVVIVNCSGLCPAPSLASIVVNRQVIVDARDLT
ncbi:3-ketoacyl-CoA synthase 5-like protein [Drosera capensis]